MDTKDKVRLYLVPHASGFSTGNRVNLKCNVEYNTPPTAQMCEVKRVANPYSATASYESPMKKSHSCDVSTITPTRHTAIARPFINDI
eukprot:6656328-Ditylum_brightwellii.AAC.1